MTSGQVISFRINSSLLSGLPLCSRSNNSMCRCPRSRHGNLLLTALCRSVEVMCSFTNCELAWKQDGPNLSTKSVRYENSVSVSIYWFYQVHVCLSDVRIHQLWTCVKARWPEFEHQICTIWMKPNMHAGVLLMRVYICLVIGNT